MDISNSRRRLAAPLLIGAIIAVLVLAGAAAWALMAQQAAARQLEVAARGSAVMPFDLTRTTHIFTDQPDGGLQQVRANDPADSAQIALIRSHLQVEAAKFQQGDFDDPMAIHGMMMPGLTALRQGYVQITVAYAELPDGAEIRYTTADPAMIAALHDWFTAQRSDHGGHTMDHSGS